MTRLEIRRDGLRLPKVFLDGVRLEGASASRWRRLNGDSEPENEEYTISIRSSGNKESITQLLSVPLDEVDERVRRVTANVNVSLDGFKISLAVSKRDGKWAGVEFVLSPNLRHWKNPWSIAEFGQAFYECVHDMNLDESSDEDNERLRHGPFGEVSLVFSLGKEHTTMGVELKERRSEVKRLLEMARERVIASLSETSLVQPFNFPEEIRVSCEQYLLYFAQFLKDVGIDASTEIRHEGGEVGQVLFSVTPADGQQALDRVRQALELYLKLSQSPTGRPDFSAPPEVQALQRQFRYLQNELDVAEERIAQKNITLEMREAQIAQLKERQVFDQAQLALPQETDEPEVHLFRGTVKLKKFDAKIADVDVPKIYLLLKEWIVGPYQNETLASYLHKKGFSLLERGEPILPLSQEIPVLPPVEEDEDIDSR